MLLLITCNEGFAVFNILCERPTALSIRFSLLPNLILNSLISVYINNTMTLNWFYVDFRFNHSQKFVLYTLNSVLIIICTFFKIIFFTVKFTHICRTIILLFFLAVSKKDLQIDSLIDSPALPLMYTSSHPLHPALSTLKKNYLSAPKLYQALQM